MFKVLLIAFLCSASVVGKDLKFIHKIVAVLPTNPSICDEYVPSIAPTQEELLEGFASQLGSQLTLGALGNFFDGSIAGTTNFTNDSVKFATLLQHWSEFFGSNLAMNCTDGAFPVFSGNSNLTAVHELLGIKVEDFSNYVESFVNAAAFSGISQDDQEKLRIIIFSFRVII